MNSRRRIVAPRCFRKEHRTNTLAWSGRGNVRFGSKADICSAKRHVRFTPESRRQADDLYMVVAGSELGFYESGEGKNLRLRPLHPNLFQNRLELLPEPVKGDSRLPNIDHAPPARHRSGNVCKYSPNRPVG